MSRQTLNPETVARLGEIYRDSEDPMEREVARCLRALAEGRVRHSHVISLLKIAMDQDIAQRRADIDKLRGDV